MMSMQSSRIFRLLLLCAAFFPSCLKQPVLDTVNQPTVVSVPADGELLRIADEARAGLPVFFRQLARSEAGASNFSVKYPFFADEEGGDVGTEHIWLTGIHFKNGRYYGKLAGTPVSLSGMKRGDTVTFIADDITDWMYVKDGKIVGGFSIKYLLEQIPKDKRNEVQNKLLEMFED